MATRHVKIKNLAPKLDLNPMVDLAFLLVTFFMLATSFKTEEPIQIEVPFTATRTELNETDLITVSVSNDGRIFLGIDGKLNKKALLRHLSSNYEIAFSEFEVQQFSLLSTFGSPINQLKNYLKVEPEARAQTQMEGIPIDSTRNELVDWLTFARVTNPNVRFAIRADNETDYEVVKRVIDTFQDNAILRFSLVTNLKQGYEQ
jgi:biopolymer transport protein ExbD